MIDPTNVTKFDRTKEELEEWLLFCVIVAGKTAVVQARALDSFLSSYNAYAGPFAQIRAAHEQYYLDQWIRECKIGKYETYIPLFRDLAYSGLNLRTCTPGDLEAFKGIGPKTSRYFILHSRPNQRLAVLDRHTLSYMVEKGLVENKTIGSLEAYREKERLLLNHLDRFGINPAEFDQTNWNGRARLGKPEP